MSNAQPELGPPEHCPKCDYALEGLPPSGVCPECGCPYDDRFLIVRGYASGAGATAVTASPRALPFVILSALAIVLFQAFIQFRSVGWAHFSSAYIYLGMIALFVTLTLIRRWDVGGPPCQLWLCKEGYWFRDRVSFVSPPARQQFTVGIAVACGLAVIGVTFYASVALGSFILVTAAIVGGLLYAKRGPPLRVLISTPVQRDVRFIRWEAADAVTVGERPNRQHVIGIEPARVLFLSFQGVSRVDILAEISPERAASIQTIAFHWIEDAKSRVG